MDQMAVEGKLEGDRGIRERLEASGGSLAEIGRTDESIMNAVLDLNVLVIGACSCLGMEREVQRDKKKSRVLYSLFSL